MKKLLSILGTIGLTASASSSIVACKQPNKVKNLKEIFKTAADKNLGPITMVGETPKTAELLTAIKAKNNGANSLTVNDFEIKGTASATSATITGKGNFTGEVTLTYTKKVVLPQLDSVIKVIDLGPITMVGETPKTAELLTAIKAKNNGANSLTVNDFEIKGTASATSATITGKGNFTGEVTLTYTKKVVLPQLDSVIKVIDLGPITMVGETPKTAELLTAIKAKNTGANSLTVNDFEIKGTASATSATITGKGNFTGEVTLTYTKKVVLPQLDSVIKVIDLGPITMVGETPKTAELLTAIKAKNTGANSLTVNDFEIKGTASATSATITGKGNFTGEVTLTYTKKVVLPQLDSVIKVIDLGPITMVGETPKTAELLTAIKAKNTGANSLTVNDFEIKGTASATSATITGKGNFTGEVTLTYTKKVVLPQLDSVIKVIDLGPITMVGETPKTAELLTAIKAKNTGANSLTVNDFEIKGTASATSATITGKGNFTGEVTLTYTKKVVLPQLDSVIKVIDLGPITMVGETPKTAELLTAIKAKNTGANSLTVNDFEIKGTASATSATITGKGNFTGEVTLTYTKS